EYPPSVRVSLFFLATPPFFSDSAMQRVFSSYKLYRSIPSYARNSFPSFSTVSIGATARKLHESEFRYDLMKWGSIGFRRMSRFASGFSPLREKPLDSIVDIHRLKDRYPDDIASIWDDYHIGRGHIGTTMKAKLYHLLEHRAKEWYFISSISIYVLSRFHVLTFSISSCQPIFCDSFVEGKRLYNNVRSSTNAVHTFYGS
ncbi:hypothetical protein KIW84_040006, partial [Lathyrus oleraceus]